MIEIISGIIAGFFVDHWGWLFGLPALIGLTHAIITTSGAGMSEFHLVQAAKQGHIEALAELQLHRKTRWQRGIFALFYSSVVSFVPCLIIGGIRLMFFS